MSGPKAKFGLGAPRGHRGCVTSSWALGLVPPGAPGQRCPHQEGSPVAQRCSRHGADRKPVVTCSPFTGRARTGHAVRPAENPARGWVSRRRQLGTAGQGPGNTSAPRHMRRSRLLTLSLLSCRGSFIDDRIKGFLISIWEAAKRREESLRMVLPRTQPLVPSIHPPAPSQPAGPSGWHHPHHPHHPPPPLPPPHPCSQGQAHLPPAHQFAAREQGSGQEEGPGSTPLCPLQHSRALLMICLMMSSVPTRVLSLLLSSFGRRKASTRSGKEQAAGHSGCHRRAAPRGGTAGGFGVQHHTPSSALPCTPMCHGGCMPAAPSPVLFRKHQGCCPSWLGSWGSGCATP